ncbi:hypothetical protein [Sphingomonas sp. OK281]|uniref:hypothetical protein n=1 Tax=Sphingomonas sp. OK281 TaxID=1881067 RepID=UPI001113746A|nr:hypothetical protein [Sphingomonas sp. OK281]
MAQHEPIEMPDAGMCVHGLCPVEANGKNILDDGTEGTLVRDEILDVQRAIAKAGARQKSCFVTDLAAPVMMMDNHQTGIAHRNAKSRCMKQKMRNLGEDERAPAPNRSSKQPVNRRHPW